MNLLNYINRSIEYLFYSLFLLVPLVFAGNTSELFEFNKMWLTFIVTTIILALWISKMILLKKVVFKRTFFDIFILLFLISQILSTFISLDSYISFWGYYSRWNGGLLSTFTYIVLFYAFVSNFFLNNEEKDSEKKSWLEKNPTGETIVKRSLLVSIISGFIVAIWAIPSHFGFDFTCLIFRGTLDTSCWTADFQPTVRVFGPMGQPAWLAAYLGILLPITLALIINILRKSKDYLNPYLIFYSVSFVLFYLTLLYTGSRAGMIAGILTLVAMSLIYIVQNRKDFSFFKDKLLISLLLALILVSFFAGVRLPIIEKVSFGYIMNTVTSRNNPETNQNPAQIQAGDGAPATTVLLSGGSSSFEIRKVVWRGGIDAWKANPIFGTGVETFAFAYYKHRPPEHNKFSEWNFLYNKAHNEYINILTTTGSVGFLTYMSFILAFIFLASINIFNKKIKENKYTKGITASFSIDKEDPIILGLLLGYISMLMSNFFGFSVVITNIYLFLIPAFVLIYLKLIKQDETRNKVENVNYVQWSAVGGVIFVALLIIIYLARYWNADTTYALGKNYNQARAIETAFPLLDSSVNKRQEPVFVDELAVNKASLALALSQQPAASNSAELIQTLATEALESTNKLNQDHPNNIVFSKSRVRILYTLANIDPRYFPIALEAVKQTSVLAPTDASILYNLGVLYGQNGDSLTASQVLEQTIEYKPDYLDAHYALSLFYYDLGVDATTGELKDEAMRLKAINQMKYILKNLNPDFQLGKDTLNAWETKK